MANAWTIEYANRSRAWVEQCLFEANVELPTFATEVNLFVAPLGSYDIILGMKWLWQHHARVDCFYKIVECLDDLGNAISLHGIKKEVKLRQLSASQLRCNKKKGCQLFVIEMEEMDGNGERKESFEDKYPYLHDFHDVFPEELSGLPPKRVFDFSIDLVPGVALVSKAHYRMITVELVEFKLQLQELLDKGLIRPNMSP
ncbi:uncharacterized protein LOC131075379 [Cryptomeria japonica]|uniref:uncharacterized protein LOC131075379 n=1 Tax=Cryptomeria japonica TaxID=3369 RepID=UPI0027DA923D|nr:uncharacterized protein LOC131075379 [Cryptomeria japonica]